MRRIYRVAALVLLTGLTAAAQIHGTPASVTSLGPHGEINGTPASVTSLGPFGWQAPRFTVNGFKPRLGQPFGHNRFGFGTFGYGAVLPYYAPAYPLAYPYGVDAGSYGAPYDYYPDGYAPMGTDPRAAYGAPSAGAPPASRAVPPAVTSPSDVTAYQAQGASSSAAATEAPAQQPVVEPEPTVLVFLDGHRRELRNFVIVGDTLYDLAFQGRRQAIPLSELDIPATYRANEERGNDFHLPAPTGG
jgi:hypothetical protein